MSVLRALGEISVASNKPTWPTSVAVDRNTGEDVLKKIKKLDTDPTVKTHPAVKEILRMLALGVIELMEKMELFHAATIKFGGHADPDFPSTLAFAADWKTLSEADQDEQAVRALQVLVDLNAKTHDAVMQLLAVQQEAVELFGQVRLQPDAGAEGQDTGEHDGGA